MTSITDCAERQHIINRILKYKLLSAAPGKKHFFSAFLRDDITESLDWIEYIDDITNRGTNSSVQSCFFHELHLIRSIISDIIGECLIYQTGDDVYEIQCTTELGILINKRDYKCAIRKQVSISFNNDDTFTIKLTTPKHFFRNSNGFLSLEGLKSIDCYVGLLLVTSLFDLIPLILKQ